MKHLSALPALALAAALLAPAAADAGERTSSPRLVTAGAPAKAIVAGARPFEEDALPLVEAPRPSARERRLARDTWRHVDHPLRERVLTPLSPGLP